MPLYGPVPPNDAPDFDQLRTPSYLTGYAGKIRSDLLRVATLYNGTHIKIFSVDSSGTRCAECTDAFSGKIVISDCPVCQGTGLVAAYTALGDFVAVAQFSAKTKTSTEMGDSEGNHRRDSFVLIGAPLIQDRAIFVTIDTKRVYKIVDIEPDIVGFGGEVITQLAQCAPLSKGAPEYQVITW